MRMRSRLLMLAPCIALSACVPKLYEAAIPEFATSATEASKSLRAVVDDTQSLCVLSRRVSYLDRRLHGQDPPPEKALLFIPAAPPSGVEGDAAATSDQAIRDATAKMIKDYAPAGECSIVESDREIFGKGLDVLAAYAGALKDMTGGAAWSSSNLQGAAEALGGLKDKVLGSKTMATVVAGMDAPLHQLVTLALRAWAAKEFVVFTTNAAPAFERVLTLADALVADNMQTIGRIRSTATTMQASLQDNYVVSPVTKKVDPAGALAFYKISSELFDRLAQVQVRQRAAHEVIVNLSKAHEELRKNGARSVKDLQPEQRQALLDAFAKIVDGIATLRGLKE